MHYKLIASSMLFALLSACSGSGNVNNSDSITILGGTGPLPGDPVILDENTGEPLPPIERIQLAAGRNEIPFSDDLYNTRRYSLPVTRGVSYSIEVINDEASSSDVVAKLRTERCPEGANGVRVIPLPRITSRTFDYNATRSCELIVDIEGVQNGFHKLFIEARLSVADGLIQDPGSLEPNNSANSAYPIESGAQYISTMGRYDDSDYFSLQVTAGQTVNLSVPAHDSAADNPLRLELLDRSLAPVSGVLLSSGDSGINTTININFTGLLILKLSQATEGVSRNYSLTATLGG